MPSPTQGAMLRALREARGLSLRELATEAGLDHGTIGKIERDETVPTAVTIARLAAALSVKVSDLTGTSYGRTGMARGRLVKRDIVELPVYIARRGGQLHDAGGRSMSVNASGSIVIEVEGNDLAAYGLREGDRLLFADREPVIGDLVALRIATEIWIARWAGDHGEAVDGSFRAGEIIGVAAYRLQPIAPAIQ